MSMIYTPAACDVIISQSLCSVTSNLRVNCSVPSM